MKIPDTESVFSTVPGRKGFYLYFLFLSVFLTKNYLCRSAGFWKTEKNKKYRNVVYLSCYEIEHPIANNRKDCQNFSKQNLFTIARQSSANNAHTGVLFYHRQMENREGKAKFLHTRHGFVHVFSPYLVPFCGFVSTPKNKTATPNFFLALTFWSQRCLFFAKSSPIGWMTTI